ncbi:MAG: hypothetical protein LBS70_02315 [Candidatus Accumulibacter sp.]|jgi:hypothetical protein|nr:hypothetical protein [Accumulibacter sp.]
MLDRIRNWLKPKADPRLVYKENRLGDSPPVDTERFPRKAPLFGKGLFAYRCLFLVSERDAARVQSALCEEFPLAKRAIPCEEAATNARGFSVHAGLRPEFNGVVVELLTNSAALFASLDALRMQTLPPWLAFPDLDPEGIGSLQGSLDYWWRWLFMPYFSSLNEAEKNSFLESCPPGWAEFIRFHASPGEGEAAGNS